MEYGRTPEVSELARLNGAEIIRRRFLAEAGYMSYAGEVDALHYEALDQC
jgi:hypothetical protein